MASIVKRGDKYSVVFTYKDHTGKRKQKWDTYPTYEEAVNRKMELEENHPIRKKGSIKCRPIDELLGEYVSIYGKNKWSLSVYSGNVKLI